MLVASKDPQLRRSRPVKSTTAQTTMNPLVKVIQPSGILDRTKASQFEREINEILAEGADIVLIDFQDVTFMDSSGLGVLVSALKTVKARERKIFVCAINHQVRMLFELAGVDRVLEIFPNQEAVNNAVLSAELSRDLKA